MSSKSSNNTLFWCGQIYSSNVNGLYGVSLIQNIDNYDKMNEFFLKNNNKKKNNLADIQQ